MGTPEKPDWVPTEEDATAVPAEVDITKNKREFTALIRTEIFHFLRALASGKYEAAASIVPPWSAAELEPIMQDYYQSMAALRWITKRAIYATPISQPTTPKGFGL